MEWSLDFISEEDFKNHVRATIMKYGEKLESYDLKRFNSNLIDPIKLIFDKSVYRKRPIRGCIEISGCCM